MKVSVILTSYNHEAYIAQAVESILNQTYRDFELIIYDDCSSDRSVEILSSYHDERIRLVASPFNRGTTLVKYIVEHFVDGDLVAVAHSDDFWEADKLKKQVAYLEEHPEVSAVFTQVHVVDENGMPYEDENGFYHHIFDQENRSRFDWLRYFFYKGNCLCHPSVLIRREAYASYGMYTKGLRQLPDFYMWIRLCLHSEIYILPEKLTDFRVRRTEKNTSGFRKDSSVRSSVELNLITKQFLDLKNCGDFVRVFPQAAPYAKEECFIPEYALARVCLMEEVPHYKKLYGLQLLFGLLNDVNAAERLEKYYGFTSQDFFALTGRYDIFGLYPSAASYSCSLYYDCGGGYSEAHVLRNGYELWRDVQKIDLVLDLEKTAADRVARVRFDPIEGMAVCCRICGFWVNGEEQVLFPVNASGEQEGRDVFYTADPQYEYIGKETQVIRQIAVSFELKALSIWEMARTLEANNGQIARERQKYRAEAEEYRQEIERLSAEVEYRGRLFWRLRRRFRRKNTC